MHLPARKGDHTNTELIVQVKSKYYPDQTERERVEKCKKGGREK